MSGKIICPKCNGNGFVYSFNHDDRKKQPMDCDYCNNSVAVGKCHLSAQQFNSKNDNA